MTDRELLKMCAAQFELLRRLALAGGPVLRNGIRVSKWHAVANECKAARDRVRVHLAETKS